jgi:hypothetical protein
MGAAGAKVVAGAKGAGPAECTTDAAGGAYIVPICSRYLSFICLYMAPNLRGAPSGHVYQCTTAQLC